MIQIRHVLVSAALAAGAAFTASSASAQQTSSFTLPNIVAGGSLQSVPMPTIPAGTYDYFDVSFNWTSNAANANADQDNAVFGFTNQAIPGSIPPGTIFYGDPGPAPNAVPNSFAPTTLVWSKMPFDTTHPGGSGAHFGHLQFPADGGAQQSNWTNVTVTMYDAVTNSLSSTGGVHTPGALTLIPIVVPAYDPTLNKLIIDTEGSLFAPSNDTEIGLYDAGGNLVANDDDSGSGLLSQLSFGLGNGGLAPGNYTIQLGGYDTVFGPTLGATTTTSANGGSWMLNLSMQTIAPVPEPASLALVTIGGLFFARRRRA